MKVQSNGKVSRYYETFLLFGGGTQYFVKPIEFKENANYFSMDYTLRDNLQDSSFITCNFTFSTNTPYKNLKKLSFKTEDEEISTNFLEKIYIEKTKMYHYRYTSKLRFYDFKELFSKNLQQIIISDGEQEARISNNNRFIKASKFIRENVINVINLQKS
ncbi:MAG: hypothetical protein OHK0038_19740 [Flammeovirgaceae bacterium]